MTNRHKLAGLATIYKLSFLYFYSQTKTLVNMLVNDYEWPFIIMVLCINGGIILGFLGVAVKDFLKEKAKNKALAGASSLGHDSKILDTFIARGGIVIPDLFLVRSTC